MLEHAQVLVAPKRPGEDRKPEGGIQLIQAALGIGKLAI